MSRIGNKINASFVPTHEVEVAHLKKLLVFDGEGSALDTCAGEGKALKQLVDDNLITYGVEIDLGRGEKMEQLLEHAIIAPIESCIISNDAFSLVFLNPPYDYALKGEDGESERKEFIELERALRYLMPGGVLMYTIPYYQLANERIARLLATHFSRIDIARFTDESFADYQQVTVIAVKKRSTYRGYNKDLFDNLVKVGTERTKLVHKLLTTEQFVERVAEGTRKPFVVPEGPTKIQRFETRLFQKSKLGLIFNESGGLDKFVDRNRPKTVDLAGKVPPLPLGSGQISLLLASGGINGLMGVEEKDGQLVANPDELHIVRGQERVRTISTTEENEYSKTTTLRTKREIAIKAILPNGEVKKFM